MGKKGVKLDNGRNAQSSMALYWKKHNEQSKQPKKKYEPTQEEQLDQRAQSGFQKWKQHKLKIIEKAYVKKQEKPVVVQKEQANKKQQEEQAEEEAFVRQHKSKGIVKIPGFKSKQTLTERLRPQQTKQVSQADNVLKLPSHLSDISQEDIVRILREKKAQSQMAKRKKKNEEAEDVILGEDFLQSFKAPPKQTQAQKEERERQEKIRQTEIKQKQEKFFKSDILNEISKGNTSVLLPRPVPEPIVEQKIETEVAIQDKQQKEQKSHPIRPLFKPRVLTHKKQ